MTKPKHSPYQRALRRLSPSELAMFVQRAEALRTTGSCLCRKPLPRGLLHCSTTCETLDDEAIALLAAHQQAVAETAATAGAESRHAESFRPAEEPSLQLPLTSLQQAAEDEWQAAKQRASEHGRAGARKRWGPPQMYAYEELTPEQDETYRQQRKAKAHRQAQARAKPKPEPRHPGESLRDYRRRLRQEAMWSIAKASPSL